MLNRVNRRVNAINPAALIFCSFFYKIKFQSNKVCYKVSLCENLQQQSCSIAIPLSNGP